MNNDSRECPECGGCSLYWTSVTSGSGNGPIFLPGLGGFLSYAKARVLVCGDCGLIRLYAAPEALEKLPVARQWQRV